MTFQLKLKGLLTSHLPHTEYRRNYFLLLHPQAYNTYILLPKPTSSPPLRDPAVREKPFRQYVVRVQPERRLHLKTAPCAKGHLCLAASYLELCRWWDWAERRVNHKPNTSLPSEAWREELTQLRSSALLHLHVDS